MIGYGIVCILLNNFDMNYTIIMSVTFETEKNRKAFTYTAIICTVIILICLLVSWKLPQHPPQILQEFIEINLGNVDEADGKVQPLINGEKSYASKSTGQQSSAPADIKTDDNFDPESASITKTIKPTNKATTPKAVVIDMPKKLKSKIAGYNGPNVNMGNGATEDNGYKYQGNKPGGTGDAGSPNSKADSYGDTPLGGKTGGGGLRVSKGDRTIVNNYIFMGELPRATINAVIKVSLTGIGTFVTFDKGSTSADAKYANAIKSYLPNIQFNKSDHESIVTVPFNFRVQ